MAPSLLFFLLFLLSSPPFLSAARSLPSSHLPSRRLAALVSTPPLILSYHNGPLLNGPSPIHVYLLWYGSFSPSQQAIVIDFISSFQPSGAASNALPSVASWWKTTDGYTDKSNARVAGSFQLSGQASDAGCSLGKTLKKADLAILVDRSLSSGKFPIDSKGVYLVLTADDVYVENFCMNTCGFHDYTPASASTKSQMVPYVWVGNSAQQCPGLCAWPYALPPYGPKDLPLISSNKDIGMDGMVINIATLLAGTVTNPFNTGYFQGDAAAPLEAVTACRGIFGKGAYPGYAGELQVDRSTGASFNVHGVNNRMFLLPAMWNPSTLSCATSS